MSPMIPLAVIGGALLWFQHQRARETYHRLAPGGQGMDATMPLDQQQRVAAALQLENDPRTSPQSLRSLAAEMSRYGWPIAAGMLVQKASLLEQVR